MVQIDSVQDVVYIFIGDNPSIFDVSLHIKVSPGARIDHGYSDFTPPQTYTVIAEDGSTRDYTVIVSQVKLGWRVNNSPLPEYLSNVYKQAALQAFL